MNLGNSLELYMLHLPDLLILMHSMSLESYHYYFMSIFIFTFFLFHEIDLPSFLDIKPRVAFPTKDSIIL